MSVADDIRLLEDVQYRFALADTDEKLERTLKIYLVPTLLKLNTTSQPVIHKVVAICSHLSKRVKSSKVILPTGDLLTQFHNPTLGPYVKNFNLIYLDIALSRESNLEQYGPQLLRGISKLPPSGLKGYFPIVMRTLARWKFDYETPGLEKRIGLGEADIKALAGMFENLLLYDGTSSSVPVPPPYISKDGFPNLQTLNEAKLASVKLTRGAFDKEGALTLFIGTKDGNDAIASFCIDAIKRGGIDLENPAYISKLYELYFAGPRLNTQISIVEALSKSKLSANKMPQMLQLVEKGFQSDLHPKLQRAHLGLVQWVMRIASDEVVVPLTEPLLSSILSALEQSETPTDFRQFLYVCIGLIAHRNPALIQKRIDILQFLFDAVAHEHPNVKVSITECLSMVFPAVQNPSADVGQVLLFFIRQAVQSTPAVAVKFTFAFPFSMIEARGVCLHVLAQNEPSSDLRQSAKYALDPYYFKMTTQISRNPLPLEFFNFPEFNDAVSGLVELPGIDIIETMRYLRVIWLHEVLGETFRFDDEGWRDRLDTSVEVDETVRSVCKALLQKWARERHTGLERYFQYLRRVMTTGNDEQIGVAVSQLLELVTLGGKDISAALATDVIAIKDLVFSRNEALREKAAHLLGLVGVNSGTVESMVRGMLKLAEGSIERQHGAILAIGSILARLSMQGNQSTVPLEVQTKFASDLAQTIISPNTSMIILEAGMQSFSQLCIFGEGPLVETSLRDQVISRLQAISKITRHGNVQDQAVLTLGYVSFALSVPEDEVAVTKILDALYNVHEQKQVELLFSAGQALSCVAARWESKAMTPFRDAESEPHLTPLPGVLERVLNSTLEAVRSPKHPLRKAASIWLLSILQFCESSDIIKQNLERIHSAFVSLLTDRDDFVQETASKGMALVYLRGDKNMKEDLIWNLVGSITSEVRPSTSVTGNISGDTHMLGLGNTDAGEVNTYKEICNLASDTGNPELIYRFLALSSHSALWQSRKGAAIGIGSLLDQFSIQELLERNPNYAKRLVPKLYRMCRDPNPGVAKAMQDIWDAAFGKAASPLVASMFPEIMKEVIRGMGDKAWRTRQASAKATGDLISGVDINKLEPYLEDIWKMAFRVADDIKETVRSAGMTLSQQLTTSLIRSMSEGKSGHNVLVAVMPFLLGNSGLNSSAQGVQLFALRSIVKLCEEAGPLLKPMIPEIMDQLLDVLTSLEPQEVNYIGFHVDKKDNETLDESRFHAVRSSPVMNALERCIDLADQETIAAIAPVLFSKIRRAAGLPTKAGCAKLMVSLVMRKGHFFRLYADQGLKAVMVCLGDRNETVRKTYAVAAGYLARLVTHSALVKYVNSQVEKYFSEDEQQRIMSGIAIEAISRNASAAFTASADSILPFVFLAKHDPVEAIQEPFVETWAENTGGSGAIKLYIREIMALVAGRLDSPQWRVKQVSALALADACEAIGKDIRDHLNVVMPLLMKGVGGRTWKGKEAVLKALVVVVDNAKDTFSSVELDEISKVMIREAKRRDLDYKRHATAEMARYLSAFPSINLFDPVIEIIEDGLSELADEDDIDLQIKPIRLLLRANLYTLGAAAFQPAIDANNFEHAIWFISLVNKEIPSATVWSTRIAICKATQSFIGKCVRTPEVQISEGVVDSLWESLKIVAGDRGYESVRMAAAKAVAEFIQWVKSHLNWSSIQERIERELPGIIQAETSTVIQAEYMKVGN